MYLGAILLFIAMGCFLPIWIMIVLAIINVVVVYSFIPLEEQKNLEKFGDAYQSYVALVPRIDFITGFIRWLRRRKNRD